MIALVIGLLVLIGMVGASMGNKGDLDRYQQLKNKRRFSGKRLSTDEQNEMARLAKKYWWW